MKKREPMKKNPLSVALGIFFSHERGRRTGAETAKELGIGETFYRMIETGSANLHPGKILQTIKAFPDSMINMDALAKYLVAVQVVENNMEDPTSCFQAISLLSESDPKLEILFKRIIISQNQLKESLDGVEMILMDSVYRELRDFLTHYDLYTDTPSNFAENSTKKLFDFFKSMPTIYLDHVADIAKQMHELPVRFYFDDLWRWEEKNIKKFRSMYCFTKHHKSVTSKENLSRYKYLYLWEPNFNDCNIIVGDGAGASEIKSEFEKNLNPVTEDADSNRIALSKINFKTCSEPKLYERLLQPLKSDSFKNRELNAVWIFQLTDGQCVGFLSMIDTKGWLLSEGINLDSNETETRLKALESLWTTL